MNMIADGRKQAEEHYSAELDEVEALEQKHLDGELTRDEVKTYQRGLVAGVDYRLRYAADGYEHILNKLRTLKEALTPAN